MSNNIYKKIQSVDDTVTHTIGSNRFSLSPKIDQLLKWVPVASAIIADLTASATRHKMASRIKNLAVSEAIVNGVVEPLKKITRRKRPDAESGNDSFPSGHTATSFMGAEILRQALKEKPWPLAYAGYGLAIATAVVRVYNKKHWLSDVMAGAALGILSARIASRMVKKQNEEQTLAL